MDLNNREWALLFWVAVFVVVVLLMPAARRSVPDVLRSLANHRILVPFALMVTYTAGVIAVLVTLRVWDMSLATPTIVWFLTTAVVNFLRLPRAMDEHGYFRNLVRDAVAAPVLVQFLIDLHPFSLGGEILLQGGFIILGILAAVAAIQPEHASVQRFLKLLIGILGFVVAAHSTAEIFNHWSHIDFVSEAKKFLLPIGMTAAFLPFMYGLTLYAAYESAAAHMRATVPRGNSVGKAMLALALRTRFSVAKLRAVTPRTRMDMARATTLRGAKAAFDVGRAAENARILEVNARKQRLLDNAGMQGVDESGQQLDQREFAETKESLRYIHTCHAGHYRQRGKYRDDLLELLGAETFTRRGLPKDTGINMYVSDDGQQWWACRRTITGWVFAIGACGAPNDCWEFEGPQAPSGGPGASPGWRHFLVPSSPGEHW